MKKGFTLIEILVAVSIIGILSTIGLITYGGTQAKARDAVRKSDMQKLALALEGYFQKNSKYVVPADTGVDSCQRDTDKFYQEISPFIQGGTVPKDPKDKSNYCYIAVDKGQGFRLFAKLESCQDEKAISLIDCQKITYRYSLVSEDLTVTPAFDDVVATGPPGTVNLLANPGFENGLDSWTWWKVSGGFGTASVNNTIAHSGVKSAELDYSQTCRCNPPGIIEGVYLAQTFGRNVQPGQTYNISFWARHGLDTSSGNTVNAQVYVTERGQTPTLTQLVSFFNVGMSWTQFSGNFIVPSNWTGKDLQIVLTESDTRTGMTILYDDVVVTQGEPTTPGLAACTDGSDDQQYSSTMFGCDGLNRAQTVSFAQASSLCAQGWHVCSLDEYLANGGRTTASNNRDRWLDTRAGCTAAAICQPNTFAIRRTNPDSSCSFSSHPGFPVYIDACGQDPSYINASSHNAQLWGAVCCKN